MDFRVCVLVAIAALVMVGCSDDESPVAQEVVRAIKTYEISEPAGGVTRSYSGTLKATDTSALGFAVAGTVKMVKAAQGDSVKKGQVLAELDKRVFQLEVNAARAELDKAQSTYVEKQSDVERKKILFQKGWVTKAALEQATSTAAGANAQLNFARARLGVGERNLANTTLTAPFDGRIADRKIEPFQEVSAGQALFQINSEGALEIDISVSDSIVSRLNVGATVKIDVTTAENCGCTARITEIGTASGTGNTVAVTAALIDGPQTMLPGMSAQVEIPLASDEKDPGFLVPLTAIAEGDDRARGYLFVFDRATNVVRKTAIEGGDGISGNLVGVTGNLKPGDLVAAAGVSFLRDGQRVKLLGERAR